MWEERILLWANVACSRVQRLTDLLFSPPFPFQRISALANSQRLHDRQMDDNRLLTLHPSYQPSTSHSSTPPPTSPDYFSKCTPSPPSSGDSTLLPTSPDYLSTRTPTLPSSQDSTPPPMSPDHLSTRTPTPPSSQDSTPPPQLHS